MSPRPMRIGIIGCGVISPIYLKGAQASRFLDVVAVADRDPQMAAAQGRAFEVPAVPVEVLIADPSIELVVNLTVPNAHHAVSRSILEAGKHVYTEKPLTVSLEEGRDLLAVAERHGLRVGCAPDTFFGAAHQTSRDLVDEGRIGRVIGGSLAVLSHGMEAWHPNPDFFFQPGGGPVLDLGPYYVTQLVNLLGPVAQVMATASVAFPTRRIGSGPRAGEEIGVATPTSTSALLVLESGARITFDASWDVWKHRREPIELYGTEGSLLLPNPNFMGGQPRVSRRDGDWVEVSTDAYAFGCPNRTLRSGQVVADHRSVGLADMAVAIRDRRPHKASGALALHVLDVLLAIARSAADGVAVAVETRCDRPAPLRRGCDETVFLSPAS